jgi:hypothetical protein
MKSVVVATVSPSGRQARMSVRPGSTSVRSPKKPVIGTGLPVGGLPVGREVVLAAQPVIVDRGHVRDRRVDTRRRPTALHHDRRA